MLYLILSGIVLTFLGTVLILKKLIPLLMSKKMNQPILEIGPRWHKNKSQTPTMGGLSFILAVLISSLLIGTVFCVLAEDGFRVLLPYLITLAYAVSSGLIGIIDDRQKLLHKSNEGGLTAPQKYALQLLTAVLYLLALRLTGFLDTSLYIPFWKHTIELGIFYYPIALLLLTGVVNAVNLTDGIDGLAATLTVVTSGYYTLTAGLGQSSPLGLSAGCTLGGALGFLVYNFYPARIFMGDTGSLFLGAMIAGMAFLSGDPLFVLIAGFVFIAETASVIIQTLFYKFTRIVLKKPKRFFAMTPLHHHFEHKAQPDRPAVLKGHEWSEIKIVSVFALTAAAVLLLAAAVNRLIPEPIVFIGF